MNGLDDVPSRVYRAITFSIVFYFALFLYGRVTGEALALFAAEFVFGVIAIGVGTVLYLQTDTDRRPPAILGAVVCLVIGGMLQFAYLFTRVPTLDTASSLAVFAGIGFYIYVVWYAD